MPETNAHSGQRESGQCAASKYNYSLHKHVLEHSANF